MRSDQLETITGAVIRPGDRDYDAACITYVGRGAPAAVVRPRDAQDVAAAIRYAVDNSLLVSVRSGGHSALAFGTNTGGVVVDLSSINDIDVLDAAAGVVRIGAGATWGAVATALQPHGLALTSGDTTSVGVGGLTLGGGVGWMVRKYGLTIDSMLAAEVVTADGRILRASEEENPDLFWAVRGGGGNCGVVTRFEFSAAPVTDVVAGSIVYALEDLPQLVKGWREVMRVAPDELSSAFVVMPAFAGNPPAATVFCCYAGSDEATSMGVIEPLLRLGTVVQHEIVTKAYPDVLEDAHPPEGIRVVVKNVFVRSLDDDLVQTIGEIYGSGEAGVLFLRSLGGAMARVPANATAFGHRDVETMLVSGTFIAPDASDADIEQALQPWQRVEAFGCGSYVNFLSTATPEDVAAIYPPATYERLAMVKQEFDPNNVFSQNHNVRLTG